MSFFFFFLKNYSLAELTYPRIRPNKTKSFQVITKKFVRKSSLNEQSTHRERQYQKGLVKTKLMITPFFRTTTPQLLAF